MNDEIPSNSNAGRQRPEPRDEEARMTQVVTGKVVTRKKPMGRRFKETFIVGTGSNVRAYVFEDVIVPNIKDMIADVMIGSVERTLFGEGRSGGGRRRGGGGGNGSGSYTRYGSSDKRDREGRDGGRDISRRARSQHDFDEIIIDSRIEAEEVLDKLYEFLSKYKEVKVSDLYDACNITWQYTDNKWGWTSLQGSSVERVRSGGYVLILPDPKPLK